jgi:2-succinyl-5-enolpyruvyl-6-hydroxy-3-cyclohexene-1-carboxylate synthase
VTAGDHNTALARALVDEWARAGATEAVLAPGSRSTPLALALAADKRLRLSVFLDERSAAFFALGTAKATDRPAVLLCTSGTAAANFHPAVLEAHHGRVPLLVCTADRPPDLRDTGAGQTTDQVKLYGGAVRWYAEVAAAGGEGLYWRSVASRAWASAVGPPAGPVHLDLPFAEPLVPTGGPVVVPEGRPGGRPWTESAGGRPAPSAADTDRFRRLVAAAELGLVVAGWGAGVAPAALERFAAATGWPVLADGISGLRSGPHAVSTYDPLLRVPGFAASGRWRPDLVVHLGAPLTGRPASAWLSGVDVPRVLVDPDGAWLDPHRSAWWRVGGDPEVLLAGVEPPAGPSGWLEGWLAAEAAARAAIDGLLDSWDEPFEGRVARDLVACLPEGATVVVGSSMPVRDVESFAAPRSGLRVLANRGVNGIDGFVSTVLGVAAGRDRPGPSGAVVALLGDLTLLHDAGGLLHAAERGVDATLVVVDNDGGGIFSFLPQAALDGPFEALFGTPHGLDLLAVARAYGVEGERVGMAAEVVPAVLAAVAAGGVRLVVVPTDRTANVARHREAWAAVAAAVAVP